MLGRFPGMRASQDLLERSMERTVTLPWKRMVIALRYASGPWLAGRGLNRLQERTVEPACSVLVNC
jgi:hypothetical protein